MTLRELWHSRAPSSWPIFFLGTGRRHCNLCIIHDLSTAMYRSRGQPEPTETYCILDTACIYTRIHLYFSSLMLYMQKCNNWCGKCRTNLKSFFLKIPWILELMLGQRFLFNMLGWHTKQWNSLRLLHTWFSLILLPAFLVFVFHSSGSSSFSPANPCLCFLVIWIPSLSILHSLKAPFFPQAPLSAFMILYIYNMCVCVYGCIHLYTNI